MNEKPFQNFDNFNFSEEEIKKLKEEGLKPENSSVPSDQETLEPVISEEELNVLPEDFHKVVTIREILDEKRVNLNVLSDIQEFAINLKKKYGPSVYDSALYHALLGSRIEEKHNYEDFEDEDSILKFVENL